MSDTPHYALSQDYELMFVLLENGPLLGFVDYEHGSTLRDPVQIKRVADGKYFEYRAGVRGLGYLNAWGKNAKDMFIEKCRKYNLSFIVPNADAEARAETAGAEVARLKLKCGEAAPEGTEIFHVFGSEMVICPSCGEEIEEPWDEPGTDSDDDGNWHGVIECRGCDSKVEVHSQLIHFWTAKLADAEAARRAVAESEG